MAIEDGREALRDDGAPPRPNKQKKTRSQKTKETYRRLVRAAVEVIGDVGYANATIARITMRADLALGTFYSYFGSRQEMFDKLLPLMGEEMIDYVRNRVLPGRNTLEREELGIRAFFEFMVENPAFYRLLNEAETMAPNAHAAHFKNVAERYLKSLRHGVEEGEITGYEDRDLEVLVYILMSARSYMVMRFGVSGKNIEYPPEWVIDTYLRFLRSGLNAGDRSAAPLAVSSDSSGSLHGRKAAGR